MQQYRVAKYGSICGFISRSSYVSLETKHRIEQTPDIAKALLFLERSEKMINIKKTMATLLIFATVGMSVVPLTKPAGQANVADNQENFQVAKTITEKEPIQKEDTKEDTTVKNTRPREPQVSRGNLNRNEVTLLAMVIEGEAADEPYEGKVAVGAVILNRLEDKQFPKTLSGVVQESLAFESVMNNQYKRPLTQESVKAAQAAIQGADPTNGALYFWNPVTAKSKWVWSRPVTDQIGRHVFAK